MHYLSAPSKRRHGNTALHLGLAVESVSVLPGISKLYTHCDIQAPFTVRNDDGFSPLHWAMSRIMASDQENLSAVLDILPQDQLKKIMQIQLTETSSFYKHVDYKGDTILHALAVRQNKDHLEMILSKVTLEELESVLAIQMIKETLLCIWLLIHRGHFPYFSLHWWPFPTKVLHQHQSY